MREQRGHALAEPIGSFTEDAFTESVDVNIKGRFPDPGALPHLTESSHASVINVVSAGAWLYSSNVADVAAAKSAMVAYTKSMAGRLRAARLPRQPRSLLAPSTPTWSRNTGPVATEWMARRASSGGIATADEMVDRSSCPRMRRASSPGPWSHADGGLVAR